MEFHSHTPHKAHSCIGARFIGIGQQQLTQFNSIHRCSVGSSIRSKKVHRIQPGRQLGTLGTNDWPNRFELFFKPINNPRCVSIHWNDNKHCLTNKGQDRCWLTGQWSQAADLTVSENATMDWWSSCIIAYSCWNYTTVRRTIDSIPLVVLAVTENSADKCHFLPFCIRFSMKFCYLQKLPTHWRQHPWHDVLQFCWTILPPFLPIEGYTVPGSTVHNQLLKRSASLYAWHIVRHIAIRPSHWAEVQPARATINSQYSAVQHSTVQHTTLHCTALWAQGWNNKGRCLGCKRMH